MSELIDRQALKDYVSSLSTHPLNEWDTWGVIAAIDKQPTVAASPWHRVEEPPKEVGCYLVVGFDRHWFYDIAEYFPIDNEWAMNENQPDSTYIRYWMHMPEPPKEDA